jgi:hypothetical protein
MMIYLAYMERYICTECLGHCFKLLHMHKKRSLGSKSPNERIISEKQALLLPIMIMGQCT